jgi:hypothetical protein
MNLEKIKKRNLLLELEQKDISKSLDQRTYYSKRNSCHTEIQVSLLLSTTLGARGVKVQTVLPNQASGHHEQVRLVR